MKNHSYKFIIIILFLLNHCAGLITQTWKPTGNRESIGEVRVLIGRLANKQIKITNEGILSVFDINDLLIKKSIDLVQINSRALKAKIRIKSDSSMLNFEGIRYRGDIILQPYQEEVLIINIVPLEKYLYSVVPSEVPFTWHEEALKAQAICARTYVIREMINKSTELYDVTNSTSSQVYSGIDKESPRTTKAVDDTMGTILLYDSKPIQAFFHSNAGGYTEKPENVWASSLPYLVHLESPHDAAAPNYSWEERITFNSMNELLGELNVGAINDIKVLNRNISQRVEMLEIKGDKRTINIKGKDFRKFIGETKLKSSKFGIKKEANSYYIKGLGFGHGVGMSQWGAYGMAKDGDTYSKILSYYYPNTYLAKIIN